MNEFRWIVVAGMARIIQQHHEAFQNRFLLHTLQPTIQHVMQECSSSEKNPLYNFLFFFYFISDTNVILTIEEAVKTSKHKQIANIILFQFDQKAESW